MGCRLKACRLGISRTIVLDEMVTELGRVCWKRNRTKSVLDDASENATAMLAYSIRWLTFRETIWEFLGCGFSYEGNSSDEAKMSHQVIPDNASTYFNKPANYEVFLGETKKIDWTIKAWQLKS